MKCWVHKDMNEMQDKVKQGVQEARDDVTEKDTCTINLTGPEKDFWLGSEAGMLGCYCTGLGEWCLQATDLITEAEWGQELSA